MNFNIINRNHILNGAIRFLFNSIRAGVGPRLISGFFLSQLKREMNQKYLILHIKFENAVTNLGRIGSDCGSGSFSLVKLDKSKEINPGAPKICYDCSLISKV